MLQFSSANVIYQVRSLFPTWPPPTSNKSRSNCLRYPLGPKAGRPPCVPLDRLRLSPGKKKKRPERSGGGQDSSPAWIPDVILRGFAPANGCDWGPTGCGRRGPILQLRTTARTRAFQHLPAGDVWTPLNLQEARV